MKTRSQTKQEDIERENAMKITIDFDEASKAWRENKIKLKNGCYKYKTEKQLLMQKKQ